jgi:hypothetical protein
MKKTASWVDRLFVSLLLLLFIGLKLTGEIAWSWWWVLSPVWIPFVLGLLFLGLGALINRLKS